MASPSNKSLYTWVLLPLCLSWRILLANRMPIMDCDEVYNYWEPLHYLLYGYGLQTWEYAHEYALRTYAYLLPLAGLSRVYETLLMSVLPPDFIQSLSTLLVDDSVQTNLSAASTTSSSKLILFLLLRSSLAASMAFAKVKFCQALEEEKVVSPTVSRWTLLVLQTAAGMAHASGALLPSTTWTVAWLLAATCLIRQQPKWFVLIAVTATLSIGWPFGVVVLLPLGVNVLIAQTKRNDQAAKSHIQGIMELLLYTAIVTCIIQAGVMVVDHQHYGTWISPTLNIFQYNAQGGGDELYGVEPTSYYIKNLLLNFNGVTLFAALSIITALFSAACSHLQGQRRLDGLTRVLISGHQSRKNAVVITLISVMYLWLAIVVPRPHKEERFLFPIYPVLCFGAVVSLDVHLDMFFGLLQQIANVQATPKRRAILHALIWIPTGALSLLRVAALRKYYSAPLAIYAALHTQATTEGKQFVCTCGEWYRFPSSFTLPANHEISFLSSSFQGQLPQPFSEYGSKADSQQVLQPFNDQNKHEPMRYSILKDCAYVIDLQESTDCQVPDLAQVLATAPFLNADKTISTFHRTLYIPGIHEKAIEQGVIHYQNYVLYKL